MQIDQVLFNEKWYHWKDIYESILRNIYAQADESGLAFSNPEEIVGYAASVADKSLRKYLEKKKEIEDQCFTLDDKDIEELEI